MKIVLFNTALLLVVLFGLGLCGVYYYTGLNHFYTGQSIAGVLMHILTGITLLQVRDISQYVVVRRLDE